MCLRNFEGRIHPHTRANYLASPLFVIAYAIAGRVDIDFVTEPLATLDDGKEVLVCFKQVSNIWYNCCPGFPERHLA